MLLGLITRYITQILSFKLILSTFKRFKVREVYICLSRDYFVILQVINSVFQSPYHSFQNVDTLNITIDEEIHA